MQIKRHPKNPIVVPGIHHYRRAAVFNPGVILHNGEFFMYERAVGSLRPFQSSIGLLKSSDGIHFEVACDKPVFTGEMAGFPQGSPQDARVVNIDGIFYMTYAIQPFNMDCMPNGIGVPTYSAPDTGWSDHNLGFGMTRSGIAVSQDGVEFKHLCFTTPSELDDRNNVLFPEKINGKFALLRRPKDFGSKRPGIWISFSDDLFTWTEPDFVAASEETAWEGRKIGAAAPPIKTEKGWLLLYHGVDEHSVYRVGAMLLDLNDPRKVLARTKKPILEPTYYYERFGLVIPNVVFPTANVLCNGEIYIYYGCCDTCIALATVPLDEMLEHLTGGR